MSSRPRKGQSASARMFPRTQVLFSDYKLKSVPNRNWVSDYTVS